MSVVTTSAITRGYAESFFAALGTRDPVQIAPYVADDAEWLIVGPIELFPSCGQHLGKAAVLAAYERMRTDNKLLGYARDFLLTDGESASALTRLTGMQRMTGAEINVRIAKFARFRDGQVYEFCAIVDTLGAAEQALGRSLIDMRERAAPLAP